MRLVKWGRQGARSDADEALPARLRSGACSDSVIHFSASFIIGEKCRQGVVANVRFSDDFRHES